MEPGSCGQAGSLLFDAGQGFLSLFFCPLPSPVHSSFKLKYLSGLWSALSVGWGGGAGGEEGWERGGEGRAGSCSLSQPLPEQDLWGPGVGLLLVGRVGGPVLGALRSRPQRVPPLGSALALPGHLSICSLSPAGPFRFSPHVPPFLGLRGASRSSPFSPCPLPLQQELRTPARAAVPLPFPAWDRCPAPPGPLLCCLSVLDHSRGFPSLAFPAPVLHSAGVKEHS